LDGLMRLLPAFTKGFGAAAFAFHFVPSEDWSGREDLNAPEAHKPPWRVASPASGGLRHNLELV